MSAVSAPSYNLMTLDKYDSPQDTIDGILQETINAAQKFSRLTCNEIQATAGKIALAYKAKINNLTGDLNRQVREFGPLEDSDVREAMQHSWAIAEDMRKSSMLLLKNAYSGETQKISDLRGKIQNASFNLPPSSMDSVPFPVQVGAAVGTSHVAIHYLSLGSAVLSEKRAAKAMERSAGRLAFCQQEAKAANLSGWRKEDLAVEERWRSKELNEAKGKHAARAHATEKIKSVKPAQVFTKGAIAGVGTAIGWAAIRGLGGAANLALGSNEAH